MSLHYADAVQVLVVSVVASAAAEADAEDLHLGHPQTFLAHKEMFYRMREIE